MRDLLGLLVILITLLGVALGRFPRVRMNRATIAVVGATALMLLGVLSPEGAFAAVDASTIALLFGMMILNANLRLAGFFDLVARRGTALARTPRQLLAVVVAASGVLSAIFLNDTVVLALTPLVLEITAAAGWRPLPFLVALATAANVGSAATIVGNPQNMLVATSSGIGFVPFLARLGPPALLGLGLVWGVVALVFREDLRDRGPTILPARPRRIHRPLLRKGLLGLAVLLGAMVAGMEPAPAALLAGSLVLVTRRLRPERVFREVDWSLLVFFCGLFVITEGATVLLARRSGFDPETLLGNSSPLLFAGVAALLSNAISNVPAVMLLRPVIPGMPDPESAWLSLALVTTFAGNLTLLGSVANLIVAESARARGVHLGFRTYLRAGVPITLLTLGVGLLWLMGTG